ncbi:MAG: hypothetical protein H6626_06380 [Pseudobdellovibrionaceae bacterium]|nr:MAG: hypothetical protein H6626_06380 [Pseudobdellovibrionaceae bacterium]
MEVIIIRINLFSVMGEPWWKVLFKMLLASTVPLSIFIRLYFFMRPPLFSTYEVLPENLVIRYRKSEKRIRWEQVKEVKFSWLSPRFLGGFTLILSTGTKWRFFSALHHSHKILEAVYRQQPALISEARLQKYTAMSHLVDVSWQRLREKLRRWPRWMLKYLAVPAAVSVIYDFYIWRSQGQVPTLEQGMGLFLAAFSVVFLVGFICNSIEEKVVIRQLRLAMAAAAGQMPTRQKQFESKVEGALTIVFFLVLLVLFYLGFSLIY